MKKFSLLILSVLLLSCSSDSNDEIVDPEGNFLDVYNGVIWKGIDNSGGSGLVVWYVFTTKGFNEYIIENGCQNSISVEFGVADDEDGSTITVLENSKNLLKLENVDSNGESTISTLSVSEDGNFLNGTDVVTGETGKQYKAPGPCK